MKTGFKLLIAMFLIGFIGFKIGKYYFKKHTLETYQQSVVHAPFDVLIIPGLPFDSAEQNPMLKARMYWAKKLYTEGIGSHLIFSGDAVHTHYIEGMCMKILADSMGIDPAHTFIEMRALHGTENVDYGLKLASELGFKKVAVATDPFQSIYLEKYEQKNNVFYLPFPVDCMKVFQQPLPIINAEVARVQNFIPLKERGK